MPEIQNVRARFICQSVRKYRTDNWDAKTQKSTMRFLYEYEFGAVTSGAENIEFFASTPSGSIKLTGVRDDLFIPGSIYNLDFSNVDPGATQPINS